MKFRQGLRSNHTEQDMSYYVLMQVGVGIHYSHHLHKSHRRQILHTAYTVDRLSLPGPTTAQINGHKPTSNNDKLRGASGSVCSKLQCYSSIIWEAGLVLVLHLMTRVDVMLYYYKTTL